MTPAEFRTGYEAGLRRAIYRAEHVSPGDEASVMFFDGDEDYHVDEDGRITVMTEEGSTVGVLLSRLEWDDEQ